VEGTEEAVHCDSSAIPEMGGSETVLLVEDEESVRQLVRETLQSRGYQVIEAENGEQALRAANQMNGPIHLLLTDVVMPGMGGKELAQQILQAHPGTRVLFLSGYAEDTMVPDGILDSGSAFLQKPFTLQNLARKVREVLRTEN
jgi:DNA-binding NtrC family response regulator